MQLLKNKLLIILAIFLVLVFTITTNCFAAEKDSVIINNSSLNKNQTIFLPVGYGTDYNYYLIQHFNYYDEGFYTILYLSESQIYSTGNTGIFSEGKFLCFELYYSSFKDTIDLSSLDFSGYTHLGPSDRELVILDGIKSCYVYCYNGDFIGGFINFSNSSFVYSNHTIFKKDTDEVVFQKPPQTTVSLMGEMKAEEIPQLILTILEIIIPIFLTIFGMLFVIYLIRSKNLLHL